MKSKNNYQPSLLINSDKPNDLKLKSEILSVSTNINKYLPIVDNNKSVAIFESLSELSIAVKYSSLRNQTLLEMRRVIDGINLIKKYPESSFLLEIKLSKYSLKTDIIVEYLQKNILQENINRIIFSVERELSYDKEELSFMDYGLDKLRLLGFATMIVYKADSLLFDTLIKKFQWMKLNIDGMSIKDLIEVMPFIELCKNSPLKIIFSGVDNYETSRFLDLYGFKFKQGDFIGKATESLISGRWGVR
jgi:hypothetical protein